MDQHHLTPTPPLSPDDTEVDTPPRTHSSAERKNRRHLPPPEAAAYRECMKNHAAAIGGHAVDGCGEYMPATPAHPTSLKCAACGCHRNFHRREPESPTAAITPPFLDFRCPQSKRISLSLSPPFRHALPPVDGATCKAPSLLAAEERRQDPSTPAAENPAGRKRFRTKFSGEQKEKMQSFAEKVGWKLQRSEEAAAEEFCREVGVPKGVLKVWMHNNKNTFGKREFSNGGNIDGKFEEIRKGENGGHYQNGSGGRLHFHDSNNGSCSSA